ncbi:hypothetical protein J2Z42_000597 [Clostridium algifaecis]|uniref:Uncharacterized protein n=1 Tax=Clostridium algifaecis TaxID=1472040 RepID=A0ABS4KPF9_9CLOT|nr:DUF960 family protein [Clostridium algifaecis]MBP2031932.1 hypothetical protein [Clostridium algifaecis]
MFDNKRYITIGIRKNINKKIQMEIWNIIDRLKSKDNFHLDYLQVFELKEIENTRELNEFYNQKIVHFQEQHEYKEKIFIKVNNPVNSKIYVIDDSKHTIMMEASEY